MDWAKNLTPRLTIVVSTTVCYYSRVRRFAVLITVAMMFSACGHNTRASVPTPVSTPPNTPAVPAPPNKADTPAPKSELEGLASYYAEPYHGRRTASGEIFDSYNDMTAAHRTLPFNTVVRVTNKKNSQSVEVRINDRGPFVDGRVIDLSFKAAQKIDIVRGGVAPVKLTIVKEGDRARTPASPSTASPQPVYAVQVGAFSNPQGAEDLRKRLARKFHDVSVQAVTVNQATIYRVRIGNESDLMSAEKLASQLKKQDLSPFVVRVN